MGVNLVQHPLIRAGAFTGSRSGGVALWRAAQARAQPIPFFAEMSSVNPIFVFPGASAARASAIATGLHASITGSVGQLCTKPGLIFVVEDAATKCWLDALAPLLSHSAPGAMLTSAIRSTCQRLLEERAGIEGVRSLAQAATPSGPTQAGAALQGVDVDTFLRTPALHEEIFGPTSLVVYCSSPEDFLRCARALEGQLTATVWAELHELQGQDEFLWTLEQRAGRLVFNGFPTGVEVGKSNGAWRPLPSDNRQPLHFRRHARHRAFYPSGRLSKRIELRPADSAKELHSDAVFRGPSRKALIIGFNHSDRPENVA